jgi:hypothetical protein
MSTERKGNAMSALHYLMTSTWPGESEERGRKLRDPRPKVPYYQQRLDELLTAMTESAEPGPHGAN